jgi:transcriptional regulator with XRE-family HTH domain
MTRTMNNRKSYNSQVIDDLLREITPRELSGIEKRMLLAVRIDDAIKTKGWKKKDFAKAIGKKPSEVSKWLSGTHNFTADTLFDIERVLDIQLFRLENKQETTFKTYIVSVSNKLSEYHQPYGQEIMNDPLYKSFYKAKSSVNTQN